MKISTKGRYALEALTYMASLQDAQPVTIKVLSDSINVPERYLEQLFFLLRKAHILDTKRGPSGGYFIALPTETLTAGDIVRAVEGALIPVACLQDKSYCTSDKYEACLTRPLWSRIAAATNSVLDTVTLASLGARYQQVVGS